MTFYGIVECMLHAMYALGYLSAQEVLYQRDTRPSMAACIYLGLIRTYWGHVSSLKDIYDIPLCCAWYSGWEFPAHSGGRSEARYYLDLEHASGSSVSAAYNDHAATLPKGGLRVGMKLAKTTIKHINICEHEMDVHMISMNAEYLMEEAV